MRQRMVIGELYEAVADEDAYAALPARIADFVGARACLIHQFEGPVWRLVDTNASYCDDVILTDHARCHPDGLDIWTEAALRSGCFHRAQRLDDLVSEDAFRRSLLWNEVFRRNGDDTGHSMARCERSGNSVTGLALHRAFGARAFGPVEMARVDLIAADVHRIVRARRLIKARDERIARLDYLLEGARASVLLVGPDLAVIEASPAARALLDRCDGLRVHAGRLRLPGAFPVEALRAAVEGTIARTPVGRAVFLCPRAEGMPPWRLTVLPLAGAKAGTCLILVSGNDPPPGDRTRMWLAHHHGATPAEVATAEGLLAGLSPEETAAARGVGIATVRTQIKRLLEKTDTHTIGALLLLLARLA